MYASHPTVNLEKVPTRFRTTALALAVGLSVGLAGCETASFKTTDPYTGEEKVSKTAKGAGIGAIGGLATSIIIGGNRKRLLIGAGIGALAGGLVGRYMDREDAKLRAQLRGQRNAGRRPNRAQYARQCHLCEQLQ